MKGWVGHRGRSKRGQNKGVANSLCIKKGERRGKGGGKLEKAQEGSVRVYNELMIRKWGKGGSRRGRAGRRRGLRSQPSRDYGSTD